MTTTYELYTNENGTPKLVEGKAPAIIERVEALETSVETLEGTLDNGVVTSVNGNTGDVTPEQTGCLPLSGGTMSGPLKFSNEYISRTTKTNSMNISGGDAWRSGGYFEAYGPQNNDGMVMLVANNGTTSKHLKVTISGLTYDGNNVITSTGGTINGELWLASTTHVSSDIYRTSNTGRLHIGGGSNWDKGALLYLDGKDNDGGTGHKGGFQLQARNSSTVCILDGRSDGVLSWCGNPVSCLVSESTGVNGYVKYSNGLIIQWGRRATGSRGAVTFPISFSNINYVFIPSIGGSHGDVNWGEVVYDNSTDWTSSAYRTNSTQTVGTHVLQWFAIGY